MPGRAYNPDDIYNPIREAGEAPAQGLVFSAPTSDWILLAIISLILAIWIIRKPKYRSAIRHSWHFCVAIVHRLHAALIAGGIVVTTAALTVYKQDNVDFYYWFLVKDGRLILIGASMFALGIFSKMTKI